MPPPGLRGAAASTAIVDSGGNFLLTAAAAPCVDEDDGEIADNQEFAQGHAAAELDNTSALESAAIRP
jgi:hypothetical protein